MLNRQLVLIKYYLFLGRPSFPVFMLQLSFLLQSNSRYKTFFFSSKALCNCLVLFCLFPPPPPPRCVTLAVQNLFWFWLLFQCFHLFEVRLGDDCSTEEKTLIILNRQLYMMGLIVNLNYCALQVLLLVLSEIAAVSEAVFHYR